MANEVATLIGDLVHSRHSADRAGLHARLTEALEAVNATPGSISPLRITVGDEYQGTFESLSAAVRAAWRLRVRMLPDCDVRQGLGWGEVRVLQHDPPVEDGPGWWVARDAVHTVELAQERPATSWRRTAYCQVEPGTGPDPVWVQAALVLCDQAVGALSTRSLSVLDGLLEGRTQREVAQELGISPSAVSQRVRADGLGALLAAEDLMGGGRP
jgi:DNA-binding transcriptional LysR family regulator